jgi:rhodanese-related sulfurtransferase
MSAKYTTKKILVKRRYQFLAVVLIALAGGLLLIPRHQKHQGNTPEHFLKNLLSSERYISTDHLADRMINGDPVLLLVDTRPSEEFNSYSLPNAINVPLSDFFSEELNPFLNQDIYDVVLFSNDQFISEEAWLLGNRLGYKNLYVLEGGLNSWFNTIVQPPVPDQTLPQEAFDLYDFRIAAGKYFGISDESDIQILTIKSTPKKVVTTPKKKNRIPEGGC